MKIEKIPLTFLESDFPEAPFSLPISCHLTFTNDKVTFFLERKGTLADESGIFEIDKKDILKVEAIILPDLSEEDTRLAGYNNVELSQFIIYQKDQYEIVDYFKHKFESLKSYWIKAAIKYFKKHLNIEVELINKNDLL